jgi:negative regulator of PHO system
MPRFSNITYLSEGTGGKTYRAFDHELKRPVVCKQFIIRRNIKDKKEKEQKDRKEKNVPTWDREIGILKELQNHRNIVQLLGVYDDSVSSSHSIILILEDLSTDLHRRLQTPISPLLIKSYLHQLLTGVSACHANLIVHRDLKPANLLLDDTGLLKIADFGLARSLHPMDGTVTPGMVTMWYRAPEILLGDKHYTEAADLWSVGCIFGEMLRAGEPLFQGGTALQQLNLIMDVLGTPNPKDHPYLSSLRHSRNLRSTNIKPKTSLKECFSQTDLLGFDLLQRMLQMEPSKRITATNALRHKWFDDLNQIQSYIDQMKLQTDMIDSYVKGLFEMTCKK